MAKLKFPYSMQCPKCTSRLKIGSPKLVGKRIECPSCGKRVDVVTPDEDGSVPYLVEEAPEPEPDPEPTEEELFEAEERRRKKEREKLWATVKHVSGILWLLFLLGAIGFAFYEYVWKDMERKRLEEENRERNPWDDEARLRIVVRDDRA